MLKTFDSEKLKKYLENEWLRIPTKKDVEKCGDKLFKGDNFTFISYGKIGPFSNWVVESDFLEKDFEKILRQADIFFEVVIIIENKTVNQ